VHARHRDADALAFLDGVVDEEGLQKAAGEVADAVFRDVIDEELDEEPPTGLLGDELGVV